MPQLGLGLGLHKSSPLQSPLQQLVKAASAAWNFGMPNGTRRPTLAPRTLQNGVRNGLYQQNVSVDVVFNGASVGINYGKTPNRYQIYLNLPPGSLAPFSGSSFAASNSDPNNIIVYKDFNSNTGSEIGMRMFNSGIVLFSGPITYLDAFGSNEVEAITNYLNQYPITLRYQLATPIDTLNSPFTNPVIDLSGAVGKNLFDPITQHSQITTNTTVTNFGKIIVSSTASETFRFARYRVSNLNPGSIVYLKTTSTRTGVSGGGIGVFTSSSVFLGADIDNVNAQVTVTVPPDGILDIRFYASGGVAEITTSTFNTIMVSYENIAYEPYGKANGLLTNFAGTSADGYVVDTAPNGKQVVGVKGEGTDSVIVLPSNAPNPVGTQDFAFGFVFKTGVLSNITTSGYILSRANTGSTDMQYGFLYTTLGLLYFNLEGVEVDTGKVLTSNTYYKMIVKRISGVLTITLTNLTPYSGTHNASLTSRNRPTLYARPDGASGFLRYGNHTLFAASYNNGVNIADWETKFNKFCAKEYGL